MTREKLIEAARKEHRLKVRERVDDPAASLLGSLLLFSADDSLTLMALALEKNENLIQFLRNFRRMMEMKIELEGSVASIHTADVFMAEVVPEQAAQVREIAKTDPAYLETAGKLGLVRNVDAIRTTAESAWLTLEINTPYRQSEGRVIPGKTEEILDRRVQRTPFTGFDWPKRQ